MINEDKTEFICGNYCDQGIVVFLEGKLNNYKLNFLIDTGAGISVLNKDFVSDEELIDYYFKMKLLGPSGESLTLFDAFKLLL